MWYRNICHSPGSVCTTEYDVHPEYPTLRDNIPLTYALTMKACLRQHAMERPTFDQILELIHDVSAEVSRGKYLDGDGRARVCPIPSVHLFEDELCRDNLGQSVIYTMP